MEGKKRHKKKVAFLKRYATFNYKIIKELSYLFLATASFSRILRPNVK